MPTYDMMFVTVGDCSVMLEADRGVYVGTVYQHKGISLKLFFAGMGKAIACPSRALHLKLYGFFRFGISHVGGIFG